MTARSAQVIPRLVRAGDGNVTPALIARELAAGRLRRVLPGTYLRTDLADDLHWRVAAIGAWRPDAVLLGDVAASLTFWRERTVPMIDVACETTVRRPGFRFRRRGIPPELVVSFGATHLTHPALTALDLAVETEGEAIDRLLRSRMARIGDLRDALAATPYRRGNRERRRLLLQSRAEPWSYAERLAHTLLHRAGIRGWYANHPIRLRGRDYLLDIAFPHLRLAVEIDGREFHSADEVFESDRDRQNALVAARWRVLRFTYRMLVERPEYVLDTIRRTVASLERRRQVR